MCPRPGEARKPCVTRRCPLCCSRVNRRPRGEWRELSHRLRRHRSVCTVRPCPQTRSSSTWRKVQMFSSLNKKELRLIAKAADVVTVNAGHRDRDGGDDRSRVLSGLMSGQATVRRNGRKVATLGPGQLLRGAGPPRSRAPLGHRAWLTRTWSWRSSTSGSSWACSTRCPRSRTSCCRAWRPGSARPTPGPCRTDEYGEGRRRRDRPARPASRPSVRAVSAGPGRRARRRQARAAGAGDATDCSRTCATSITRTDSDGRPFGLASLGGVVEHDQAVGAGGGDHVGARAEGLVGAVHVDALCRCAPPATCGRRLRRSRSRSAGGGASRSPRRQGRGGGRRGARRRPRCGGRGSRGRGR